MPNVTGSTAAPEEVEFRLTGQGRRVHTAAGEDKLGKDCADHPFPHRSRLEDATAAEGKGHSRQTPPMPDHYGALGKNCLLYTSPSPRDS